MNTKTQILAGLVLGSALLVGCEERPEARPAPDRTTPSTPSGTPSTPSTTPGTTTPDKTGVNNQEAQSRAQTLILQFHQQVDSGDYQGAERTLQQLESMRSSLPQSTQQEIDQLRKTLREEQGGMTPTSPTMPEPATPPGS